MMSEENLTEPAAVPYKLSELSGGTHTFRVQDRAGNEAVVKFVYDKTAPSVLGVKQNTTYKKTVTVRIKDKNGI